mgnify:CR=1 FL=1
MIKILRRFFDFCGGENRRKFYLSIFFGVLMALFEALKIPAIVLMLDAVIRGNVTVAVIWQCLGICLVSIIGGFIVKYFNTIIQCEAGYGTAAEKRIEIAEHLRYLPMGYFNNNSIGYITSVTTNTMENLGDVATRVVMLTTQGVLTTLIIAVMLLFYDWRIGLVVWVGFLLLFLLTKYVSLGSVWAGASFPFATWYFYPDPVIVLLAFLLGALILWKHRSNIVRLIHGNENKFSVHRKKN